MKRHWITAILGILTIIMPYLGFPLYLDNFFYIVSGTVIAVISFLFLSEEKHKNSGV